MDYDNWLEKAKRNIDTKLKVGKKFEVRDLFDGVEWNELSKGDRINFGKFFSNAVKEGKIPAIERIKRGDNNHARYVKIT